MHYASFYFLEIRFRFLYIILACLWSFLTGYVYKYSLLYVLTKPFLPFHTKFLFFELTEGLYTMIHIAGIFTLCVMVPWSIYQFLAFSIPGWYRSKRTFFFKFLSFLLFLWCLELFFIYSYMYPPLCEFFVGFEFSHQVKLEYATRIQPYISRTLQISFGLFLLFQFPCVCLWLFSMEWVSTYTLCEYRKIAFFLCLLISAMVSPPECISQCILSCVLYLAYEIIVFFGFFFEFPPQR